MLLLVCIASIYIAYKKGEINGFHKAKKEFERYLDTQSALDNVLRPGLEAAEHLVDRLEEADST